MRYEKKQKTAKRDTRTVIVRIIAGLIVFCTVCSLAIPALALDSSERMEEALELHTHNEFCHDREGNVICPLPEIVEHTHSEECYEIVEQETVPTEQETVPVEEPHVHSG